MQLSKKMSLVLRHQGPALGVAIDDAGARLGVRAPCGRDALACTTRTGYALLSDVLRLAMFRGANYDTDEVCGAARRGISRCKRRATHAGQSHGCRQRQAAVSFEASWRQAVYSRQPRCVLRWRARARARAGVLSLFAQRIDDDDDDDDDDDSQAIQSRQSTRTNCSSRLRAPPAIRRSCTAPMASTGRRSSAMG